MSLSEKFTTTRKNKQIGFCEEISALKFIFPKYSFPLESRFAKYFENENKQIIYNKRPSPKTPKKKGSLTVVPYNIITGKDTRTTIMIKNIPNILSKEEVIKIFNFSKYANYIYIPNAKPQTKTILGFAFINVIDSVNIIELSELIKKKQNTFPFSNFKQCEICYSKLQGVKALTESFDKYNSII